MAKIMIIQDEHDKDICGVYRGSAGIPWIRSFSIHVDDIEPVFGKKLFDQILEFDSVKFEVVDTEIY